MEIDSVSPDIHRRTIACIVTVLATCLCGCDDDRGQLGSHRSHYMRRSLEMFAYYLDDSCPVLPHDMLTLRRWLTEVYRHPELEEGVVFALVPELFKGRDNAPVDLLDCWSRPITYELVVSADGTFIRLVSQGPNGQDDHGKGDDIEVLQRTSSLRYTVAVSHGDSGCRSISSCSMRLTLVLFGDVLSRLCPVLPQDGYALRRWLTELYHRPDAPAGFVFNLIPGLWGREDDGSIALVDCWGAPVTYELIVSSEGTVMRLVSLGPNGQDDHGEGDDIEVLRPRPRLRDTIEKAHGDSRSRPATAASRK
jgi:hypothetical protein